MREFAPPTAQMCEYGSISMYSIYINGCASPIPHLALEEQRHDVTHQWPCLTLPTAEAQLLPEKTPLFTASYHSGI